MCMNQSKKALSTYDLTADFKLTNNDEHRCEYIDVAKRINSNEKDLRILQLNIRGAASKLTDLQYLLDNSFAKDTPDVITLCETWLNNNSPPLSIPGYSTYVTNRTHKQGGGVAILVAAGIPSRKLQLTSNSTNQECCFVEIKTKTKPIIIGSIYRPPNTNPDEFTDWIRSTIPSLPSSDIVIGLDHNMDLLKCDSHRPTREFLHTLLDLGLMPVITQPTRLSHTSATLIDNILINQKENENYDSYILEDNISDHLPCACILQDIKAAKRDTKTITTRQMKRMNIKRLNEEISEINWNQVINTSLDLDNKMEQVIDTTNELINRFLPHITKQVSYNKLRKEPWITSALMKSIKRSKNLYMKQLKGTITDHIKYKDYNNILKKVKRHAKKQYYIDRCTEFKSNTKQLWRTINKIIGKSNDKTNTVSELTINSKSVKHPATIANHFCSYFSNIGRQFAEKIPKSKKTIETYLQTIRRNQNSVYFYPTTKEEIEKIIKKLPNKKAAVMMTLIMYYWKKSHMDY